MNDAVVNSSVPDSFAARAHGVRFAPGARAIVCVVVGIGAGVLIGCGSGSEGDAGRPNPLPTKTTPGGEKPTITIVKPVALARFSPGDPIDIEAKVDAPPGAWELGAITFDILKGEKESFGSFAIQPEANKSDRTFKAEAKLKAPRQPGRYVIRVVGIGSPYQSGDKGAPRQVQSSDVPIEVQK